MRLITFAVAALFSITATADHAWGTYHWARTTSSFDLKLYDSTTEDYDNYVNVAVSDWNNSTKLNFVKIESDTSATTRNACSAINGTVRICNDTYGATGWVGIAGIWLDSNSHITRGYTKLNDSYMGPGGSYNTPEWRQMVTCQELGHDIGLDHQDENFNNDSLFTCMDYQVPPYPYPNTHDYEQLETMYAHVDTYNTYDSSGGPIGNPPTTPANFNAVASPDGSVANLTWDDVDGEDSYQIERQKFNTRKKNWGGSTTLTLTVNTTSLNDAPGSGTYRYRIRAVNGFGSSSYSAWSNNVTLTSSSSGGGSGGCKGKKCTAGLENWGRSLGRKGRSETFIREFPDGTAIVTHVFWADDDRGHDHHDH